MGECVGDGCVGVDCVGVDREVGGKCVNAIWTGL